MSKAKEKIKPHKLTESIVAHACKNGVSDFDLSQRAIIITIAFFPNLDDFEKHRVESELFSLLDHLLAFVCGQEGVSIRLSLKRILSELEFICNGFGEGKRPRRAREVSAATLEALRFQLPKELAPLPLAGNDLQDFGRVGMGVAARSEEFLRKAKGAPARSKKVIRARTEKGPPFQAACTSAQSLLLPGLVDIHGANEQTVAIGFVSSHDDPPFLRRLDEARNHGDNAFVTGEMIRNLAPDDLLDLKARAGFAVEWIRGLFAIRSGKDPLNINPWQVLAPRASAAIMYKLGGWLAPRSEYVQAKEFNNRLLRPAFALEWNEGARHFHRDMDQPIYWHIFEALRWGCKKENKSRNPFATLAKNAGLLDPSSDTFDDFSVDFGRIFRQVHELSRVRRHLEEIFARHGVKQGGNKLAPVGGKRKLQVGYDDFHKLGRWLDYLEGLLKIGIVERGRDAGTRLRLPKMPVWEFPSIPPDLPVERTTALLVSAARAAR